MATCHLLRRHPDSMSDREQRRLLDEMKQFQNTDEAKASLEMVMGRLSLQLGDKNGAYDIVYRIDTNKMPTQKFESQMFMGSIRFGQWLDYLHDNVQSTKQISIPAKTSHQSEPLSQEQITQLQALQQASGPWRPFMASSEYGVASGGSRSYSEQAEQHYSSALELRPECTGAALALIELANTEGRKRGRFT